MDGFTVLSSDIENGADLRIQIMSSLSVTADLGYVFIGKRNADTAVTGGHNFYQVRALQSGFF